MNAAEYDTWYETPRGRWVGERETALILEQLQPRQGESLLDVGCGTGYFTRNLAAAINGPVTGVDINPEWVAYARSRDPGKTTFDIADARALPFADRSFDLATSITALCFIAEEQAAISEILRVARRRFAIGLLNRHSLLWLREGRKGGGYQGAHWHTVREAMRLFQDRPVKNLRVNTAIQIPTGGGFARMIERLLPTAIPTGAFILVTGDKADMGKGGSD
jgi:SAM-dependent methyltransferase